MSGAEVSRSTRNDPKPACPSNFPHAPLSITGRQTTLNEPHFTAPVRPNLAVLPATDGRLLLRKDNVLKDQGPSLT